MIPLALISDTFRPFRLLFLLHDLGLYLGRWVVSELSRERCLSYVGLVWEAIAFNLPVGILPFLLLMRSST